MSEYSHSFSSLFFNERRPLVYSLCRSKNHRCQKDSSNGRGPQATTPCSARTTPSSSASPVAPSVTKRGISAGATATRRSRRLGRTTGLPFSTIARALWASRPVQLRAAAIRVLTGSIAKSPDGPLGPKTFFKTRALHLRSWLRRRSSSGQELRLAGLLEPVSQRAGPRAL